MSSYQDECCCFFLFIEIVQQCIASDTSSVGSLESGAHNVNEIITIKDKENKGNTKLK